ncbi:hypothetical protein B0O99DRAFT_694277 [Bisporella sp. PMI_857]|nr:hypothetical protein B0O99DRAFT_694277 [Bisporella sp. PMI_857]
MSLSLTTQCPMCGSKEKLSRCQACNVMTYCGRDHQVEHRYAHKVACNGVKKAQKELDREEQKLRAHPGDFMTPPGATIFEEEAGHFWGIHETRAYMRARYALVEALLKVKTLYAVKSALDHIMDMLRLCRGDNMGIRDLAPPLFLRLGKDQECYDFVKWWATTGQESNYDWGNMDNPYLDVKDADVFEPVDEFTSKWAALKFSVVGEVVPQEILDNIRSQPVSTIIAGNKDIMSSKDQGPLIKKVEEQVKELYKAVNKSNKYFWPALLNPGAHLKSRPQMYSHGTPEQMQLNLQYCYDSWAETPGAIDMIKDLHQKHGRN